MSQHRAARRHAPARSPLAWVIALSCVAVLVSDAVGTGSRSSAEAQEAGLRLASAGFSPGFVAQLGPEERLLGPSRHVDSPYFSERTGAGDLIGVMGNASTYVFKSHGNRKLTDPRLVLPKGGKSSLDSCGAWLLGSIYKDPANKNHWIGWYHAEKADPDDGGICNYADAGPLWTIRQAESFDGGKTWRKNGRVLTQHPSLTNNDVTEDVGNGRVIQIGAYLYMFYQASSLNDPERRLHVARALATSQGDPGAWTKYSCYETLLGQQCDFDNPEAEGLGGESTPLSNIPANARYITWNTHIQRFVAAQVSGKAGFKLYVSGDTTDVGWPEDWPGAVSFYPPVSTPTDERVDKWGTRTKRVRHLYAYPSLLGADGSSSATGQDFYLYYMKLFPGDDFTKRYLFRRKVSLVTTAPNGLHRVQLSTYVDRFDGRRRTSTEMPQSKRYRLQTSAGYLLSVERPGWDPLFECATSSGDNYLRKVGCGTTHKPVRRVGWISPTKTSAATVPVYRCWDRRRGVHFASTAADCGDARTDFLLGYALPAIR